MKKIVSVFLAIVLFAVSFNLTAQNSKKGNAVPNAVVAYLGRSNYSGGLITKRAFDSLLKQGLTAKDSLGNYLKVDGFTFGYGERNLYEDSVGNLMVLTDYFTEYCPGDTTSPAVAKNIYYKTKPGDTAYFDNIKVSAPGRQLSAKSMRFVITK